MDKNFKAINEPIIDFEPGSEHRKLLQEEIERQSSRQKDSQHPNILEFQQQGDSCFI